jgi:hypothetical protein
MKDIELQQILCSKLITPDGTVLHSKHRHDYIEHTDANGEWYMLDGGLSYVKSSVNIVRGTYITITTEDSHDLIRDHFVWGSRGKLGDEPLIYLTLKNIEDDHLSAILRTQTWLPKHLVKVFEDESEYRINNVG